jgi:hypothetical protein
MAFSLCAATFDFDNAKAFLPQALRDYDDGGKAYLKLYQSSHGQEEPPQEDIKAMHASMQAHWASIDDTSAHVRTNPRPVQVSTT